MALNFMGNVKTLTANVTSLKKELTGVYDVLRKIKGIGPAAFGDVNAAIHNGGQFGNGSGTPLFGKSTNIPTTPPRFGNQNSVPASKPSSAAQFSNYESTSSPIQSQYLATGMRSAKFGAAVGVAQTVMGVIGSGMNMLPDVGTVATRAGSFYGSSAMFGGTNRTQNQLSTMAAMKGGITGPMGTAEAFGTFTNYSYMPGSANMQMGLQQTSAAAKALNMDNATAANAVGALSTGSMGAQLYQYGIRQYDNKGNLRTPGAIAKDVMQRVFYPGKDVTKIGAEQFAKDSMGMNLDYQLSTMGITGETARLMKASMGNIAAGKSGELTKFDTSGNPLNPFYKINQSEESLTQKSEKGLMKGAETAAGAIEKLNKALEHTPELILAMKGAMQTFTGTKSGSGVTGMFSSLVAGGTNIAQNVLAYKGLKALTGSGTAKTAGNVLKTGAKGAKSLVKGGGAAIVGDIAGDQIEKHTDKGSLGHRTGSALKWGARAAGAAAVFNAIPVGGQIAFGTATAIGTIGGFLFGGPTDGFSSSGGVVNPSSMSGASSQPMAMPVPGASMSATSNVISIGAGFGAKDPTMTTMTGALNYHTGEDTPMAVGTPVHARFAGTVISRNASRDLGISVEIDHGDGYSSIYGHLNEKLVRVGQEVKVGDLIGKSGASGRVRGAHLHFELRKGKTPVDPKTYNPYAKKGSKGQNDSGSSGSVTPANVGSGVKASAKELHSWLVSQGLSANGATGVIANLIAESGLKTNNPGDGGTSNGIAQWHLGRLDNLKKFAAAKKLDPYSLEAQKMFLLKEMKTYGGMWKQLQNDKIGVVDATALFMRKFERPKDQSDSAAQRRASLGLGAIEGGPTGGFNTAINVASTNTVTSTQMPASVTSSDSGAKNVYVTLQIQQANQQEAEAFAKTIKKYLEKDNQIHERGRR